MTGKPQSDLPCRWRAPKVSWNQGSLHVTPRPQAVGRHRLPPPHDFWFCHSLSLSLILLFSCLQGLGLCVSLVSLPLKESPQFCTLEFQLIRPTWLGWISSSFMYCPSMTQLVISDFSCNKSRFRIFCAIQYMLIFNLQYFSTVNYSFPKKNSLAR